MRTRNTIIACALAAAIAAAPLAGCSSQGAGTASSESAPAASGKAVASGTDENFIIYLGTNDKDTNEPVYSHEESKERAKAILMKDFGGYTIQEAEGGWRADDGKVYEECTLVIILSDTDADTVHAAASELIAEFHQSSVLINTELVKTEYYDGN